MIKERYKKSRAGRRPTACACAVLVLALGLWTVPAASQAAGAPGPAAGPELRALLANDTNVLSEDAMAQQEGSGLRAPSVINNEPAGPAKVLLWDEMRIAPLLINPGNNGVVTGATGGR